jgi:HAD superfamily hydrolase (TIGR01509 family)
MWIDDIEALLLDLDGTLVDSDAAVERGWRRWAAQHGVEHRLEAVGIHGRPSAGTIRLLCPRLSESAVREASAQVMAQQYDDLDDLERCPGADELLGVIERRRLPWAIVTSGDRRLALLRLRATGIEPPPVLITIDDVAEGKPAPEGYLRAAEVLGTAIERCLVVEDSEPGLQAGRLAGARTAAVRGLDGDLRLADPGALARMFSHAAS